MKRHHFKNRELKGNIISASIPHIRIVDWHAATVDTFLYVHRYGGYIYVIMYEQPIVTSPISLLVYNSGDIIYDCNNFLWTVEQDLGSTII